jgi:hypothetical protein
MQNFILLFAHTQSILVATVILNLFKYTLFAVLSSHQLVRNFDFIYSTLLEQLEVLVFPDSSFLSCLKFFPGFVFNHRGVGIQILSLKLYFFQFFGQSFLFVALDLLFSGNLIINF